MKVLVIEDDARIAHMVRQGLEEANHRVDLAADGATGLEMTLGNSYGLIVLDLMLPRMDGWRVCEELRSRRNRVPVLMLMARDAVDDRVRGLDSGADDYLPKPFDFREFLARVRALLRRDRVHRARVIRVGDLEIDTAQRRVARAGREIGLSHREYDLLEALAAHESQVLTRDAIQERVWMNENALALLLGVLGVVIRYTALSFLTASVDGQLDRDLRRSPPPPPREGRPRGHDYGGRPPFGRAGERRPGGRRGFGGDTARRGKTAPTARTTSTCRAARCSCPTPARCGTPPRSPWRDRGKHATPRSSWTAYRSGPYPPPSSNGGQ